MAEWLGLGLHLTSGGCGSGPALTPKLELLLGRPYFNSSVMVVNSQLVCLLPVGIFEPIMFI